MEGVQTEVERMRKSKRWMISALAGLLMLAAMLGGIVAAGASDGENQAPEAANNSSISGHKYEDLDGDGVKDPQDPPVPGVTVELWKDGAKVAETVTGGDGSYSFPDLEPGTYTVKEVLPAGWSPINPADGAHEDVTLSCGQNVDGLDFLNERLESSISGHKYEDLDGDGVKDPQDPPVPGVTVELWKDGAKVAETVTGGDGSYSFPDLEPGTYTVKEVLPAGWSPINPADGAHEDVTLSCGQNVDGLDFLNEQTPPVCACDYGVVEVLVREDLNCNGVADSNEPLIGGVNVKLYHVAGGIWIPADGYDGSYSKVTGPGAYGILAPWGIFMPPYPTGWAGWMNLPLNYSGLGWSEYAVEMILPDGWYAPAGTVRDGLFLRCPFCWWKQVEIPVARKYHISGHKYEDLDGDGVKDPQDPPVPGVTVELWKDGAKVAETVTGGDGSYSFPDLEHGVYEVKEMLPTGWYPTYPPGGVFEGIEVGCGDNVEDLDFLNRRYLSISGHKYEDLDGDGVKDPQDPPVPGVTVELWKDGAKVAETVTGGDGSYSFPDLEPGTYTVKEVLPAGWYSTKPDDGSHDDVLLPYGISLEDLDFLNSRHGNIRGIKYVDLDGDGIMGTEEEGLDGVTVLLNGGLRTAVTSGGGWFFFDDLEPGVYEVSVDESTLPDYYPTGPTSVTVELESGGTETVYFGNAPYGSISGIKWLDADYDGVRDPAEVTRIAGIGIRLYAGDPAGELLATAVTDEDGSFTFNKLKPGTYTVMEEGAEGYFATTPDSVVVNLSAGEGAAVEFGNCPYGRVQGLKFLDLDGDGVRDADEEGMEGVKVTLEEDSGVLLAEAFSGEDGTFAFVDLLPGDYAVSETVPTGHYATRPIRLEISVEPGESVNVVFANALYATIAGHKWLDDGDQALDPTKDKPGPGITVKLAGTTLMGEEVSMQTVTGDDGSFSFLLLEAGSYSVSEEFDANKYAAISDKEMEVDLTPGSEEQVDFLNAVVEVGGEEVTPPPPAAGGAVLPTTGMEQMPLLLAAALLVFAGLLLISWGWRMIRG